MGWSIEQIREFQQLMATWLTVLERTVSKKMEGTLVNYKEEQQTEATQ